MDFLYHFQKLCQVETRRSLLVMGIVLAIVLVFQSYTLPNGNAVFSVFPFGKSSSLARSNSSIVKSIPNSTIIANMSTLDDLSSSNSSLSLERVNGTRVSDLVKKDEHINGTNGSDKHPEYDFETPIRSRNPINDSSVEQTGLLANNSTSKNVNVLENGSAPVESKRRDDSSSLGSPSADSGSTLENIQASESSLIILPPAISPESPLNNMTSVLTSEEHSGAPVISVEKQPAKVHSKDDTMSHKRETKKGWAPRISMSKMNSLLAQSHVSSHSMKSKWPSKCDEELLYAKSQIENAPIITNNQDLYPPNYRNVSMFKRSYEMMEQILKVYIYGEGEKPIFHEQTYPILQGIYASEGWFMKLMENNKQFVVKDPTKAHLFYMPFSSRMLQLTLYVRDSHRRDNLAEFLKNYVDMIAAKYPFWNRTGGADHFLVACHDWAPFEIRHHMDNCIKVLCNANAARDFIIGKDMTLPEAQIRKVDEPLRNLGGKPPTERSILAFFAGGMHGYLRPILLQKWKNDPDLKIYSEIPRGYKGMNYIQHMKSSKYCICARGFEVNSPRVVEAIFYECVPVLISDNYVPPFFEVLDWEAFAVFVAEEDIPKLKDILLSISKKKYIEMHRRVKKVQKHFLWHNEPLRYDIFHMILHSVWFSRLNQI